MPYFKDKTNAVHFLDAASFAYLLPDGSVEITDAEAAKLQPTNTPRTEEVAQILGELAALDVKRIRPLAEGDTAYLATLNKQAVELRAKLKELTS